MLRSRYCFCILCAALGIALAFGLLLLNPPAVQAQAPKKGPISFIHDVAPIFKENCFACHEAKKRKGKLDMTTYAAMRHGGDNDDPIVPGKPEASYLMDLITTTTARRMPPKDSGNGLSKEQIAIISQWIQEGAKLDKDIKPEDDLLRELRVRWQPPTPPAVYPFPAIVNALTFTPDNSQLIVGGHHELTFWNVATGKLEQRLYTRAERAYALAFLPDGKLAVAGGRPGQEGDVRIYDLQGGKPKIENDVAILDGVHDSKVMIKELVNTDDVVLCLAVSADGKQLAAGGCDRQVRVWDLSAGYAKAKEIQAFENHADWVLGAAFSPDGKFLVTASRDKMAKVWDLDKKESALTFNGHNATVFDVGVQSDGKTAFSVGEDNQIRFFNLQGDGKQIRNSGGHGDNVLKIDYHPKQALLATCSADRTVRLWNATNGAAVRTLSGATDQVFAVAISPNGELVAGGSYNGEVRVWKVADGAIVQTFNASPGYEQTAAK